MIDVNETVRLTPCIRYRFIKANIKRSKSRRNYKASELHVTLMRIRYRVTRALRAQEQTACKLVYQLPNLEFNHTTYCIID